jgi:hypothetical protein
MLTSKFDAPQMNESTADGSMCHPCVRLDRKKLRSGFLRSFVPLPLVFNVALGESNTAPSSSGKVGVILRVDPLPISTRRT